MPEVKKSQELLCKTQGQDSINCYFFEVQYKKKGSNMQEISLTKKSIHWFMYKMDVK